MTRPDLVATAVAVSPAAALPGGTLQVIDTVHNQGLLPAAASTMRYYLSTDTQKDAGDRLLSPTRSVPALAAGATSMGPTAPPIAVAIPNNVALGSYYLLACADDTTAVAETNETNNCLASASTVQVTRPDLVTTALSSPPPAALPGATFQVVDTVLNQGVSAAVHRRCGTTCPPTRRRTPAIAC